MRKKCTRCGEIKETECFHKDKLRKDGLSPYCKDCRQKMRKEEYLKHKKKYNIRSRRWYLKNKERAFKDSKQWCKDNPQKRKEISLNWYYRNKEQSCKTTMAWSKRQYSLSPKYRLKVTMATMLRRLLRSLGMKKNAKTIEYFNGLTSCN